MVGQKVYERINKIPGVKTSNPQGGFYLFVDFNEHCDNFQKLGIKNCTDFCKNLLTIEHAALLPSTSLLLPDSDFSVRCSYVDYDGEKALSKWRKNPPLNSEEENKFIEDSCSLVIEGINYLERYIDQVRIGKRPIHH